MDQRDIGFTSQAVESTLKPKTTDYHNTYYNNKQNPYASPPRQRRQNDTRHTTGARESRNLKCVEQNSGLKDGCLILGNESKESGQYVTRFRINTQLQRESMGKELLIEECCPVCEEENQTNCSTTVFAFISGESFLLSLHLIALLLGVAKEAFEVGQIGKDFEIAHSSLETFITATQLLLRIFATRSNRKDVKKLVISAQHVCGEYSVSGHELQRIINGFTILAVVLIIFVIACLVVFCLTDHMTWTILTNNFAMILGTVASNLILLRLQKIKTVIRMDQHKAVLYESALLLQESMRSNTNLRQEEYHSEMNLFLRSLMSTEMFLQPQHIELDDGYKDKFELITNLQLMTYI